MTIMFCDIRGFTSRAEGMDAQSLTHFMNTFLSPMTEIITEQKGTIDKYIGDCIMAFWNAPLDDPDHAKNAVRAAQMMRRKLIELNRMWTEEAAAAGKPFRPVQMGIGINTGECCVGNFGSQQHFDYSLLGDPVNLASRLEGLGKVYGIDLVIGEETAHPARRAGADRGRPRRGQGQVPGRTRLHAAAREHRGRRVRRPPFGIAARLSPSGMGGRAAAARRRPACRGAPSGAGLRSLPAANCAFPDRGAADQLGRRLHRRRKVRDRFGRVNHLGGSRLTMKLGDM